SLERNVYQPRTQRLEGSEAILQHLQRSTDNPALASAASALIRGLHPNQEISFEAVESEWVACHAAGPRDSCRPSALTAANETAAELRAELCLLRASNAGLRERLARLEARFAAPQTSMQFATREPNMPRGSAVMPKISHAPPAPLPPIVAAQAQSFGGQSTPPASPSLAPSASLQPDEPDVPAANLAGKLKLPPALAVGSCLNTLIGRKLNAHELGRVAFPPKSKAPCWFSRLIDDDGNEVGVIVADLLAAVGLGGALMMLPPHELEAQRAAQALSEDVVSAMAEVANNLSATINQQPEAIHVRVGPLEQMSNGNLDWAKKPSEALTLELAGMGHLFLFAR
ncbi:MAG TPA: hypothetical protein VIK01_10015, partial [Polyangiaceae bacterium]